MPLGRFHLFCYITASILIAPATVRAEQINYFDMSLEELSQIKIQSSTFYSYTAAQSPGSIWVFTQSEIVNSPIEYLKDILEFYAPATTISQQSFTGASSGVRGISTDNNAKTIVMFNGQSLNQKIHYGYQAGLQSTLFGDIDRVEVINGPGAILQGSGAINGIVNFISKNGEDYPGFKSKVNLGTKEKLKKIEFEYGYRFSEKANAYFYAGLADASGFAPDTFLELDEPYTRPVDTSIDRNYPTYVLKDNYKLSSYLTLGNFKLQGQLQRVFRSRNKKQNTAADGFFLGHWQTLLATQIKYKKSLAPKTTIEFIVPVEVFDYGVTSSDSTGDKGASENHIAVKSIVQQELTRHKIAYGFGGGRRQFKPYNQYFEEGKLASEESIEGDLVELEIFAEDIFQLNQSTNILVGFRYDQVNYGSFIEPESGNSVLISPDDISATSLRIALSKQLNEKETVKFSYREGFRYPDVAYFLYHGLANNGLRAAGLKTLPELRAETIKSFELNYLRELAQIPMNWEFNFYLNFHEGTLDWKDYSEAELGTERYDAAKNGIGFGPGAFANASGTFKAFGFEILNQWKPNANNSFRASYAFSKPSRFDKTKNANLQFVNSTNKNWASYPTHLIKTAFNRKVGQNMMFNLTTFWASNVDICIEQCTVKTAAMKFHYQDRFRINSKIQYFYTKKITLALSIQNLFGNSGPAVGYESRSGTGKEAGLGDDARRFYLSAEMKL